ncbi:MAG: exonuclease domain-containing protein [Atopobiaceae bacterium]|jgi:DNA polymerase-3 subunit epsilon|nr:hypothetical protein [Atopobiaceae bacterium]MCH4180699.1 hypothetical protein [Atopobiaceae bacterium]MCH4214716.1 hypothetical protein [Atopobiaceae bacterium]MCH4276762.1 hypothetical protein [Atopobiaceae bacterium]MCI1226590.1 hypothetical protein [Atopobiaceae bacterium]
MPNGYMFFDDETANSGQRICQLAYEITDNDFNRIAKPVTQLIDPESAFEPMTIRCHRVRKADVVGKPNMKTFCDTSSFLISLERYTFVAHNAAGADLHHIEKSLRAYGIAMPSVSFIDTMPMAVEHLRVGSLRAACDHYGIKIDNHHDAMCDATACKELFEKMSFEYGVPAGCEWGSEQTPATSKKGYGHQPACPSGLGHVHGTDVTIEEVLTELASMGLRGNPADIDSLIGMKLVVTGAVPGYVGNSIEEYLKAKGAHPQNNVGKFTEYLAIADNAGPSKLEHAKEYGTKVITVGELLSVIDERAL